MQRITAIDPATATGIARDLLDSVQKVLGFTPNMMRTMAQSPAVLEAYLAFNSALSKGSLSPQLREQIALAVAETNGCDYCVAAHSALGKRAGLNDVELAAARHINSIDPKADAALIFARALVRNRGDVSESDVQALRLAGFSEGEVAEIVAHTALNIFTNYFNLTAATAIDFPPPPVLLKKSA